MVDFLFALHCAL